MLREIGGRVCRRDGREGRIPGRSLMYSTCKFIDGGGRRRLVLSVLLLRELVLVVFVLSLESEEGAWMMVGSLLVESVFVLGPATTA